MKSRKSGTAQAPNNRLLHPFGCPDPSKCVGIVSGSLGNTTAEAMNAATTMNNGIHLRI
jgi:hypothetical protein